METKCVVKILMVDDRQENLLALEVILVKENYVLVKANSGKEALKILLNQQDFALILIDVQMPIMNGFETAELIRQTEKFKHVPIIFLTASTNANEDIFKGYKTGAVDFMIKPLSPDILRAKVSVFAQLYKKNYELIQQGNSLKALNIQLKQQSKYVRSLIESSIDPMVTINPEGKITDMNEAMENILGLPRIKISGTNFVDYFSKPQIANQVYIDVFVKEAIVDYLLTIKHINGKLTEAMFNGSVYKDSKGKVMGAVITAREKSISKYSLSLIEASLDPLVTINSEGKITGMNQALTNITGITREKITGTDFFNYFTEPNQAKMVYQETFTKGFVVNFPLTILHHDGKTTDVLFNGSTYKDEWGNILGIVIVARDITAQKSFEKELIEAKSKAEDAMRSKQQFLSNMSHEIRTPLNAIIGFTNVVLKTDLNDKQKEYLNAIKLSGDSLIVLINDILDLAKVDAGKMSFEMAPFKLCASITNMLCLFETKISEKKLELIKDYDSDIPEVMVGDSVRLHQIIMNLISNSIKFTEQGKITICAKLLSETEKSSTVEFIVTDTGIGIAKNKLETIFNNFQQATSGTTRLYGGSGLGLSIVKQLVEAQGGKVSVKSEVGVGSVFTFFLNFGKTNETIETEPEKHTEPEASIKNIKVLVAEDIKFNQLLIQTLLEGYGFGLDIAENGKIALENMKNNTYDLILMDLQMPEMNGFEVTEHIRKKMHSSIPIIALTADVTSADVEKCKASGMNDYISKPIDDKLLYKMIMKYIKPDNQQKKNMNTSDEFKKSKSESPKSINLDYLKNLTNGKTDGMILMIKACLEEIPKLIQLMKQGIETSDWKSVGAAAHSLLPTFSMLGINPQYEEITRKIQEYTSKKEKTETVKELFLKVEKICGLAIEELELELTVINIH